MSSDFDTAFGALRASVTENRAENVRYRQNELLSLHTALRESVEVILEAIAKDYAGLTTNAETEFFLAMDAVRKSYESLDFDKSLEQEYSVKFGKDNVDRRTALGLVAVRPSRHSRFYSVVAPVAAALEAGNCVVLELDSSSPAVDEALSKILPQALDRDTFCISRSEVGEQYISQIDLFVNQTGTVPISESKNLLSSSQTRTIAVLDRTGYVGMAAKILTTSRMSPNYSSPYSPDLVLVNEFQKEAFITECLNHAKTFDSSPTSRKIGTEEQEFSKLLVKGECTVHRSEGTEFAVVELQNRSSPLASLKVKGPYLLILPTTGLVDSVSSQSSSPSFIASYLFGSPSVCKFIAEQLPSHVTYMHQIPPQLLVGPVSPEGYPHTIHPRYTSDMFSTPRPQFITPPPPLPLSSKLKELALEKLKPTGQRPGHAIGFFEQGILIGLGSTALIVLPLVGWGLFSAGRYSWRFVGERLK